MGHFFKKKKTMLEKEKMPVTSNLLLFNIFKAVYRAIKVFP